MLCKGSICSQCWLKVWTAIVTASSSSSSQEMHKNNNWKSIACPQLITGQSLLITQLDQQLLIFPDVLGLCGKLLATIGLQNHTMNWEYMRTTALQTSRSVEKEVEKVLQVMKQKFPYSPWRFLLEQMWRTPRWSRWMLVRKLWTCGNPALEQTAWRICGTV